jgi:nucleoside-diphosphate-sugar epimerase
MDGTHSSPDSSLCVVTGAFGYSGKYIARRLLAAGKRVRTLTSSPGRENPFRGAVDVRPYNFDRPDELARRRNRRKSHEQVRLGQ